jgi:hypothetical protein
MAENDFSTNGNDGMAMVHKMEFEQNGVWDTHDEHGYETETHIGRYIENQWLMPFIGFDWRYRKFGSTKETFGQTTKTIVQY